MAFQDRLGKLHRAFSYDNDEYPNGLSSDIQTSRQLYFSGLAPFIGGVRSTATVASFGKTGLNIPGSDTTEAFYHQSTRQWTSMDALPTATGNIIYGTFGG